MPSRENEPSRSKPRRRAVWLLGLLLALGLSSAVLALDMPWALDLLAGTVASVAGVVVAWMAFVWLQRHLLWRVGRRLAFSYVLLGMLPFLLSLALVIVTLYLLSGFFLGHLYRDAAIGLHEELDAVAAFLIQPLELELFDPSALPVAQDGAALAYYQNDTRAAGDPRAPPDFPAWLVTSDDPDGRRRGRRVPQLVRLPDGSMTLAAAFRRGGSAVVAFYDPASGGLLERELSRRSDVWTKLRHRREQGSGEWTIQFLDTEFVLQPLARTKGSAEREAFFESLGAGSPFRIVGVEMAGPLHAFASGEPVSPPVSAALAATQPIVFRHLFSSSARIDSLAWIVFGATVFLLFDVFIAATAMALTMIVGLSRAVNRLSAATEAVQAGDFSARIPARRRDQIGALQTSFNEMARSLEDLIAERAAKHALEQELEIAHEVQKSLIPGRSLQAEGVEFATYFEPSAAIGGDYFDIVRLRGEDGEADRLAVVVADVAGHGLSAGLRMAMLKAGLLTLVEEGKPPREILSSLDRLVRAGGDRAFVTSSLSLIDLAAGFIDLTNAGHPPAYLLRDNEAEEIALPGTPLGALGTDYGFRRIELQPGDVFVWLSDGFIEATGRDGEPFGYDRTRRSLLGPAASASEVRDRILARMRNHTDGIGVEDDLTLVVMRYEPDAAAVAQTAAPELMTAAGA